MNSNIKLMLAFVVCFGLVLGAGCEALKTKTSDSDARSLGEYKGLKHAIGCIDFKNEAGWRGNWEIGQNLCGMMESALYDTGRFVLVERKNLEDVIKEQDLVTSGRATKAKVAKTGVLRPAKYLAGGSVTTVEENQSGGGGGLSFKGVSLGGSGAKAQITIIAKLIDSSTGEVVAKKSITGKAGRLGLSVGAHVSGVGVNLDGFKKTPLGEAAQDCINQAAVFLAKEIEKLPFDAAVAQVSGGKVIINRGANYGLAAGQMLVMKKEGEPVIDPDSGEVLSKGEGDEIGKLKVVSVSEKIATCEVVSGEKKPDKGTIVVADTSVAK